MASGTTCAFCQRAIDAYAKLCPYCGADPATGERLDTQAVLQEVFRPREVTATDNVLEYARQRQGVVIAISLFVAFIVLGGLHQFVTMRNQTAVTDAPAVPLTELADVTKPSDETTPVPMPELDFLYDGRPQAMRTYVAERGAATPPEVLAAQAAARAAATPPAATTGAAAPGTAPAAVPGALRPPQAQPGQPLRPGVQPQPQARPVSPQPQPQAARPASPPR